jgi:nicotinamide-nucleotide adenylyltransferase
VGGLLVGRFQPFHSGHLAVVQRVRADHPTEMLLLGIGSAQVSYTMENPFTAGERFEMIERALAEAHVDGCRAVPLPDIDRHALWVAYLESQLPAFTRVYTNNPLTRLLFERAGYAVESPPLIDRARFEGTHLRAAMRSGDGWRDLVPGAVRDYLVEIRAPERLRLLRPPENAATPPRER